MTGAETEVTGTEMTGAGMTGEGRGTGLGAGQGQDLEDVGGHLATGQSLGRGRREGKGGGGEIK